MKAKIISQSGSAKEIEMPAFFSERIREDIIQKVFEAMKEISPYAAYYMAGKQNSASGNLSHSRRLWKTAYGKGISRVPRKIMWRRGDHFYWIGAETSGTRGGRQAHPPKIERFETKKKINKKEMIIAMKSAIAATANPDYIKRRYSSLSDVNIKFPIVIDSELIKMKAGEFFGFLENILGSLWSISLQKKTVRAGKGKLRNRKYKRTAGLLLVIGEKETGKFSGITIRKVDELEAEEFYPLGRLTIYTENAVNDLRKLEDRK